MKKFIKLLVKFAIVLAILLIAGVITLRVMFPPEKLKSMALNFAKEKLNREVTFDKVSLNLVGMTLDNFALSEDGSFKNGTFVKANQLVVKVALKPLFKKRVEIATVGMDGVDVKIMKQKNGSFNFDSMIDRLNSDASSNTPAEATQPAEPADSAFVIMAEKIYAKNCAFSYQDLQTGMDTSIDKMNLEINNFDMEKPFTVKMDFTTDYSDDTGFSANIPIAIEISTALANGDMKKASADIKNIAVNYKNVSVTASGTVNSFETPVVDLKGRIRGIDNKTFADFLPDLPAFKVPDINIIAQANADIEKSVAVIKNFALTVRDSTITASGNVNWGGKDLVYSVKSTLNLIIKQLTDTTAMLDDFEFGGTVSGNIAATSKNDGKDVVGQINLKDLALKYDPFVLSQLSGTIKIASADNVRADNLKGLLNKESFTSSFSYLNVKDIMNIVFNLDLSKFTLDKFPSFGGDEAQADANASSTTAPPAPVGPETFFNVKADVKIGEIMVPYFTTKGFGINANLTNASPSMKRSNGTVSFDLQEGAITDLDSFVKENKIVKIILLPIAIIKKVASTLNVELFPAENARQKGQIDYAFAKGTYLFQNGLMTIQQTHFNSKLTDIKAAGTLNFVTEKLDMKATATVLTSQTPIVIKIGGTMSDPSGKLDVLNTVGSLVGGILSPKTPVKAAEGTVNMAGNVAKGAATTGAKAVSETVDTAKSALKEIGSLFKKKDSSEK